MDLTNCGDDVTAVGMNVEASSKLNDLNGDDYSSSKMENEGGSEDQSAGFTPIAADVLSTDLSPSALLSSEGKQKTEGSKSDNELSVKIITQVEYYFSDENLVKDSFLMQRINRDKRGFVELKLIASFKKMKKLTQDISVIAAALHSSKNLQVNKKGTMVRRIAPLPVTKEETAALKTVVAVNFNETDNLAEKFGICGTVTRVRIVSKNETVPSDVRKHLRRSMDDSGCAVTAVALVEYDDDKCARDACDSLTDSSDWRHGLHVSMLVARPMEKKSSSNKLSLVKETNSSDVKSTQESVEDEMRSMKIKKKTGKKNRSRIDAILQDESAGCSSSGSETDGQDEQREHKDSGSKNKRRFSSPKGGNSPASRRNVAHSVLAHHNASLADDLRGEARTRSGSTGAIEYSSHGISPWVQRRLEAAQRESKSAGGSMTDLSAGDTPSISKMTDVISVLRQPKGPDGTRGFNLVR